MRVSGIGLVAGWALLAAGSGGALVALAAAGEERSQEGGDEALAVLEVLSEGLLPPGEALKKAVEKAPGAAAVSLELAVHRAEGKSTVVWEADFAGEKGMVEVLVDARTGAVVGTEEEPDAEEAKACRALLAKGGVGLADALKTLAEHVHGLVLEIEIDDEDDGAVWESHLARAGRRSEILLSTSTGKIVPGDGEDEDGEEDEDGDAGGDD
ncbi:MAG: PepSY domain-containing protein [Planctomycetaceae bacterium]|nr:PepSY domain-containing protein [Planctomycetaceae bacterium]